MLLSFKHKKPQHQHKENDAHDRIANNIASKFIKGQRQWAIYMQRKSERLSDKLKKVWLVLFFLLSTGYCLYLIGESFFSHKIKSFSIAPIKLPQHTGNAGDENTKGALIVSKAEYEKIHRFRLYMDSLLKTVSGKQIYDSLLSRRPGLMDSLLVLENMYQLQSSKK